MEIKKKCKVCGKRLKLKAELRYEVYQDPKLMGVSISIFGMQTPKMYECFDCLKCGCQNVVNIRELPTDEPVKFRKFGKLSEELDYQNERPHIEGIKRVHEEVQEDE